MNYIKGIVLTVMVLTASVARADEGMWLLSMLKQNNEKAMKQLGLKIPIDKIADEKGDGINRAVVSFDGGCTASFISSEGLLLTNYHCSYEAVKQGSSLEHNYIRDGFWAQSREQEIPIKGLTILVSVATLDITGEVNEMLKQHGKAVNGYEMYSVLAPIRKKYEVQYGKGYKIELRHYKNNTIHMLVVNQPFSDVRLVGVPPRAIAKFGGETDNWMWPRHNADFAFFRVYASSDNKSVGYNSKNVPYRPAHSLSVSTKGYGKGDYAMSIGYPGHTDRLASSYHIREKQMAFNPGMIEVRRLRLELLEQEMHRSEKVRIAYSAKFSASANYFKNAVGMNEWIDKLSIISKKERQEADFMAWVNADAGRKTRYGNVLSDMKSGIEAATPYNSAGQYLMEAFGEASEVIRFISCFGGGLKSINRAGGEEMRRNFIDNVNIYYDNIDVELDKKVTKAVIKLLPNKMDKSSLPDFYQQIEVDYKGDVDRFVDDMFAKSIFSDKKRILDWINNPVGSYDDDVLVKLAVDYENKRKELYENADNLKRTAQKASRLYNEAMIEFLDAKGGYYPNADKTKRLSYGTVVGLDLGEGKKHAHQTYLSEVMAKINPNNPDFVLPSRMQELYEKKQFGLYGQNGDIPTCFIVNGDATGGNSGSPMLNNKGELIGLVFDCNWESMTRDFNFDINLHRVICLDVRYILYIVDNYAETKGLVKEILR